MLTTVYALSPQSPPPIAFVSPKLYVTSLHELTSTSYSIQGNPLLNTQLSL